jgi:replication factor A1
MAIYEDDEAEPVKIGSLNSYSRRINTIVQVVSKTEPRDVTSRIDQSAHRVAEALVGDDTGCIYLTLWDDTIDEVSEGQVLNIKNAYVNLFRGSMRLNLGRFGSYELAEEAPFEEVNLDNNLSSRQFEDRRRGYDRGGFGGRDRRYGGRRDRRRY